MKVYELAKAMDKNSKEIITYLKDQGIEVKSHMNSIEDNNVELVKKHFQAESQVSATATKKEETPVQTGANREQRPNNNYQGNRNNNQNRGSYNNGERNGQTPNGNRERTGYQGNNNGGERTGYQGNNNGANRTGGYQGYNNGGNRTSGYQGNNNNGERTGYQGNNNGGNRTGGYQGNNGGNRTGGYQGNNNGERSGYQGNNGGNRTGGYQGNNGGGERTGGYQGNNGGGERTGGYQGNRTGGYQGNNGSGERTGGYQGNRTGGYQGNNGGGERTGGYQGNRTGGYQGNNGGGERTGGYQGNRTGGYQGNNGGGERTGGYQGNRPAGSGYQGNRPAGGGYQGNRPAGGGYQGNNGGGYNRPNNGGGGYKPRFDGGMNKDDDKDADTKKRSFRNDSKSDTKKFDAPLGMSRSESTNNRKGNKNTKPVKNVYNRKDYDKDNTGEDSTIVKKGQFIKPKPVAPKVEEEVKVIAIPEILTIKDLADKMKLPGAVLIKKLFLAGKMVSLNKEITFEEAEEIAIEYDIIAEHEVVVDVIAEMLKEEEDSEENMVKRPPVVCVMGHVDHGKTSLLDAIRTTRVTTNEAGGITQHIGAYTVDVNGEEITFLDTPGHEAFTSMRMRGAKSTDIAILVVAADDGVMPQTVEAISHAKAAGIQIIVAVNKIDKESANIERVKQELTEYELVAEDWGGDTIFVPVSAHTKEGISQLLEMIVLTSEILELKANPDRKARGIVIEAELDKGRGPVATILVQKGTLRVGDAIAIGSAYGKVRAMMDDKGRRVKEAAPSTPVEILGLNEVPDAGEIFTATNTEKEARSISETYISQGRERLLSDTKAKLSLDGLFSQIQAGNIKELNIIIKGDVQGSVEAMKQSLTKLSNEEVAVRIIHGGVGAINESDVTLASASNAIIIGFNVRPDNAAKETADREKVDLRLYRVIYAAIEDVDAAMKGMLDPIFEEKVIAHAEVRQVFTASGLGTIAGSYVLDGKIQRGASARITREGKLIFEGALASLKRFKDDVKEVASGYECGLVFEKFNDIKEFDRVELYIMQEVPRK